ncbi:MAG: Flp pilus assembly complex ATPase component TadA [Elusimicrobia bacterium]|nr:Flp pilus assembly complex ATPase component TadA [Elusimicrobiota bacterium]
MVFIGSWGKDEQSKKKDDPHKAEDLSIGGDLEQIEIQKERLAKSLEDVRKKEAALEAEFRARFEKESRDSLKAISREQSKNTLLEQQVQSSMETIEGLRQEVRSACDKTQEAISRAASLEKEAVEERRKTQQADLLSQSQRQRILALEKDVGRLESVLKERDRDIKNPFGDSIPEDKGRVRELERRLQEAGQRIQALESALKEPGVNKVIPPAAPVGDMQKHFNEMTQARMDGNSFLGWGRKQAEDATLIVRVVQFIIEAAARGQASDIHLEPVENFVRVRFRIDGMLSDLLHVPSPKLFPVISRIRVMCGLDPEQGASVAKPQEGRMVASVDGRDIDLRLSTFPTVYGDKAVLRLIHRTQQNSDLIGLGFWPKTAEIIERLIQKPLGMILVTGPAGSGKSTTLYTILQKLNDPARNIVTLEDPVEMKLPGVNQCTVQPKIGFTFAEGLRSILRQDPNVIMVGEIRDRDTAEIAMTASLTGHLLLTTLHTNSAVGAFIRLLDMGLEPYMVASAITAVFAQRLVRRICPQCRQSYDPTKDMLDQMDASARKMGVPFSFDNVKLFRGAGCGSCRGTGYQGRVLIFELIGQFPGLRPLIFKKAPLEEIQAAAMQAGMEPMGAYGLRMVRSGETTFEELLRIVGERD